MHQRLLVLVSFFLFLDLQGQSVLTYGRWYKIGVSKSGIYKIDRSFLSGIGIDVNALDPRTLKIYGKSAIGMLPQPNSVSRPDDPTELAIQGHGTADGRMDNGDYFLFYGSSPDLLSANASGHITYEKNIYSDTTYYFITYQGSEGKRITTRSNPTASGTTITHFLELIAHEKDDASFKRTGRLWLESGFSSAITQRTYSFTAPGILDSVNIDLHLVAESQGVCTFDIFYNDALLGSLPIQPVIITEESTYDDLGKDTYGRLSGVKTSDSEIDVALKFNRAPVNTSLGYLDYFVLSFNRKLSLYGNQTLFRTQSTAGSLNYVVSDAPNSAQVWDLSNHLEPTRQEVGAQDNEISFALAENSGTPFIVFEDSDLPAPLFFHEIGNQNIKSLAASEGIIVTHPLFKDQAERLADFHRQYSGLSVGVVTTPQIYNEFSAGAQDLTAIRDFLRNCYTNVGNLKYVLIFGDASYDYKDRIDNNTNFVPVYESRESFHPIYSHSSDDYLGFFEEDEGEWTETREGDHTLEIGVGRIPVKSAEEARNVVDKIIRYKTSIKTLGKWRTEIAYLSDDGDHGTHMDHAEKLSQILDTSNFLYNTKKIYLDAFSQEPGKYGPSDEATEEFLRTVNEGVLIIDYMGHGNENELMHERVITQNILKQLTNRQKLPLFVTATCAFGRYDNPLFVSGSENLLLNPNGGAIALLTTTRFVFANTNLMVNRAFHESIFKKLNGAHPRLGDVMKATKNNSLSGPVNRNFALLGDPMLQLNYPEYEVRFDQLSADESENTQDTLSALEEYHLSGTIQNNGQNVPAFNGRGIVTLWDIPQDKVTRGQENGPFRYKVQSNALFRGQVLVVNGSFQLDFILPRNISYKYQPGKVTMYAWNEDGFMDASGASRNFVIGGTASDVTKDMQPPAISMYLNDPSFKNGETVGTSSLLIARIVDESGVNISNNGFNQSITLTLNNQEPIELNAFYTADPGDYKSGTILFPLENLEPGKYNVILKVCDTHNNPSSATVAFTVSDKPVIRLYGAKLYPNPISVSTDNGATFEFEHDREGEKLEITVSIYNMRGSQVYREHFEIDNSPRKVEGLTWNVHNMTGTEVERGIYLYRLNVSSTLDGASNEVVNRLIIIN